MKPIHFKHLTQVKPPPHPLLPAIRREGGRGENSILKIRLRLSPKWQTSLLCCSTACVWLETLSNVLDFHSETCITCASLSKRLLQQRLHPQEVPQRIQKKKSRPSFKLSVLNSIRSKVVQILMQRRETTTRSKSCPPLSRPATDTREVKLPQS